MKKNISILLSENYDTCNEKMLCTGQLNLNLFDLTKSLCWINEDFFDKLIRI